SECFHTRPERGQPACISFLVTASAELFQPVNVAPQLAQGQRILHIDPEVPAAFEKVHDVKRTQDYRGHQLSLIPVHSSIRAAASSLPAGVTIRLVLAKVPHPCASRMPRLMPRPAPKPPPLTIRYFMPAPYRRGRSREEPVASARTIRRSRPTDRSPIPRHPLPAPLPAK